MNFYTMTKTLETIHRTRPFWHHDCKDAGPTLTLRGQTCNWCDVTEKTVENEELHKRMDYLMDPEYWTDYL